MHCHASANRVPEEYCPLSIPNWAVDSTRAAPRLQTHVPILTVGQGVVRPVLRGSPHEPSIEPLNQRIKHPLLQSDRVQKSIGRVERLFLGDGFSLSTRVIISALLRPTY